MASRCELKRIFGMEAILQSESMKQWIAANHPIPKEIVPFLEDIRIDLFHYKND